MNVYGLFSSTFYVQRLWKHVLPETDLLRIRRTRDDNLLFACMSKCLPWRSTWRWSQIILDEDNSNVKRNIFSLNVSLMCLAPQWAQRLKHTRESLHKQLLMKLFVTIIDSSDLLWVFSFHNRIFIDISQGRERFQYKRTKAFEMRCFVQDSNKVFTTCEIFFYFFFLSQVEWLMFTLAWKCFKRR